MILHPRRPGASGGPAGPHLASADSFTWPSGYLGVTFREKSGSLVILQMVPPGGADQARARRCRQRPAGCAFPRGPRPAGRTRAPRRLRLSPGGPPRPAGRLTKRPAVVRGALPTGGPPRLPVGRRVVGGLLRVDEQG